MSAATLRDVCDTSAAARPAEPPATAVGRPRLRARPQVPLTAVLFEARTDAVEGWEILRVIGEVDLASLPALRQEIDRVQGDRLAVDLSSVGYLDPMGLGLALAGQMRMRRRGGCFCLVCPPGRVRELLEEVGLDRLVEVVDSTDDLGDGPQPAIL